MKFLLNYILILVQKFFSRDRAFFEFRNILHVYSATLIVLMPNVTYAVEHKTLMNYFTDNLVFVIIYNGGWYSVGTIVIITILSMISQRFKEIFLSIFLAICGIFLMMLLYEAYEDFRWIPEAAETY
ncbi:MAG: hypothetical protein H6909_04485 [Rickettsiaceae bacterium]|nr:hypothetical protein [Rickettsiaceae bacterium]